MAASGSMSSDSSMAASGTSPNGSGREGDITPSSSSNPG
jgi:hypothetical protein